MVLSAEESAELARLQAKSEEPAPVVRQVTATFAADHLETVLRLLHAHWSQLPADVYDSFKAAAEAALAAPEPEPEPEPEPVSELEASQPEPAFGTETEPETHDV